MFCLNDQKDTLSVVCAAPESPADVSVFDTHTAPTLTVSRSISCGHPRTDPEEGDTERQRTNSLPTAAPANHSS